MAMLPFCGYNMADYFGHWLNVGRRVPNPPRIFRINWFRKDENGKFMWPGFGQNMRVLKWIVDRVHGRGYGVESPIGWMPRHEDIEWKGLDLPPDVFYELMAVGRAAGAAEAKAHETNSISFSIDCRRNSSSSVSFCAHGCGVRPIVGKLLARTSFGRQREFRQSVSGRLNGSRRRHPGRAEPYRGS